MFKKFSIDRTSGKLFRCHPYIFAALLTMLAIPATAAQNAQKVIIDTDIGDDIDDVLALALAIRSPQLQLVAVTAAWGDTNLRARLLDRLFREVGRSDIPVAVGEKKHKMGEATFSQARWAEREPMHAHRDAVDTILEAIRRDPGEITLISIAPLTNVAAALDRDPATFRKLKSLVIMGGSIDRGYDDLGYSPTRGPSAEYNIAMDPGAAKKVFASGVPLYVMPLDSTQLKLDEVKRQFLFSRSSPLTDALTLLYQQWSLSTRQATPTMFDAVAVAYVIDPSLCPVIPMHLDVDAQGYTRRGAGGPNTRVCMHSDSDRFFEFYLPRVIETGTPDTSDNGLHFEFPQGK